MKIGIDMQAVGRQRGGDETYIKNLVELFPRLRPEHDYHLYYTHPEAEPFLQSLPDRCHPRRLPFQNPFLRVPLAYRWQMMKEPVDVFHTSYVGYAVRGAKLVLAIHDLTWEFFPETFPRNRALFLKLARYSAHRAAAILVCSRNSKRDLMRLYQVPAEKIHVIYNGINPLFQRIESPERHRQIALRYGIRKPYILSVASLQPRKNLKRLVQAFLEARKHPNFDYQLVLVGKQAWGNETPADYVKDSPYANDVIQTGYVGDEDLPVLYSGATVFAYVSLYEGFGMPPIEALRCGAPVLVSNVSSFPESCGDAALFVDPTRVDEISKGLLALAENPTLREDLRQRGMERSKRFTWDLPAQQTMAAYEAAASGKTIVPADGCN